MHIENLKLRTWYLLTTPGNSITGMPLKIVELNPPFALVTDVDRDMLVIDTRVHTMSSVNPNFLRKFRKMWTACKLRRQRNHGVVCENCGMPCEPIREDQE